MTNDAKLWLRDTGERLLGTFIEAFLSALSLSPIIGISTAKSAAIAGLAAVLTYFKSTVASLMTNTISPASAVPPPAPPMGTTMVDTGAAPAAQIPVGITNVQGQLIAVIKGEAPQ